MWCHMTSCDVMTSCDIMWGHVSGGDAMWVSDDDPFLPWQLKWRNKNIHWFNETDGTLCCLHVMHSAKHPCMLSEIWLVAYSPAGWGVGWATHGQVCPPEQRWCLSHAVRHWVHYCTRDCEGQSHPLSLSFLLPPSHTSFHSSLFFLLFPSSFLLLLLLSLSPSLPFSLLSPYLYHLYLHLA